MLAALGAYIYVNLPWVEPRWRSSVLVQASGRLDYGNFLALEKELRPLSEQVLQLAIMREVDRNLNTDLPPDRMLERTKAEPIQDSGQIRVDFEDSDPERAELVSLEIADVYTRQHNAEEQGKLREERVILSTLDRPNRATLIWPLTRTIVPAAALLGLARRRRRDCGHDVLRSVASLGGRRRAASRVAVAGHHPAPSRRGQTRRQSGSATSGRARRRRNTCR